jgi:peptide/nickel transport system permease protein
LAEIAPHALPASLTPRFTTVRALLANGPALFGASVLVLLLAATLAASLLTPYQPLRLAGRPLLPPGLAHWMGTDNLGRDVFTTVLYGMRVSLAIGFLASAIALVVGVVAGSVAGYFGGAIDNAIMRVTELFQVIPRIFLMIIAVALFGTHLEVTAIAIGMTSWPPSARILRAEFMSRRESEYVLAARAIGASHTHVIVREILPNAISPMIVTATLNVATAVLLEASLAFLGLSDPNVASLGRMMQESIQFLRIAWWMSVFPGLVVVFTAVSMNLIGEGLRDVLDPKQRR